ncbi:FAD-binding protein [Rhodococcus sp. WS1]|uniref:FAD-dependent monooxygenase n=1 Tax=unclassified Rhodococcus (in: high G+C Gram-positive bacteria) TaxID=192944 RepID=UPI001143EA78|nr:MULTISPECIES: FAD-dependent monooxygenase [unclassified Rhodococcus (in: high G+C Gram-positive bacteria)]ROZ52908.1 FAD-binding protein [Rhodococcus sp. WS1]TQC35999.1 FAD-binding protein [Rhodococcus sp. WS7]
MPPFPTTPRIAVVGGGIGGLSAAAFLHRAGLKVTVYEQASQLGEVGAGLVVSPNAVRMIRRLGHLDSFLDKAVALEIGWEFRRWEDGTVLSSEQLTDRCEALYGERSYVAHRADLLDAIRAAVPDDLVHLGARCESVEDNGRSVTLRFADGTSAEADVVIGADGIHSAIRGAITTPTAAEYSGMCAYRAIVPAADAPEFARRPVQTLWIGPDHHLVHYPISGGKSVNIVAFAPAGDFTDESWSARGTVEELLHEFAGWDPRLTALIEKAGTPGRWALLDRAPLERWTHGRVALLGDAAHPMFPFFAQGAAQAIEDAAALAQCLSADTSDPEAALVRYEGIRRPRTTRIQELSRGRKDINHLHDGDAQTARDSTLGQGDPLLESGWLYGYDAESAALEVSAQ